MPRICPGYQDIPNICPRFTQDMLKKCPRYSLATGYTQDMPMICPSNAKDIPKTYPGYALDMSKICPRCAQNITKIFLLQ